MDSSTDFDAAAVFESLDSDQKEKIHDALESMEIQRQAVLYSELTKVEERKAKFDQDLQDVEYEIARNDELIRSSTGSIDGEKKRAGDLWFKSKDIQRQLTLVRREVAECWEATERKEKAEVGTRELNLIQLIRPHLNKYLTEKFGRIAETNKREKRKKEKAERAQRVEREKKEETERAERKRRLGEILTKQAEKRREQEAQRRTIRAERKRRLGEILTKQAKKRRQQEAQRRAISREEISKLAIDRGIKSLIHFTPINNLASIIGDGLYSRSSLKGKEFIYTDEQRHDGWWDWISLSVSFPNYKMFYLKRNQLTAAEGWVVILLEPKILWELECRYLLTNAASREKRLLNDEHWSSVDAFNGLFGSETDREGLPDRFATDPQAEVMVQGHIPISYIRDIVVSDNSVKGRLDEIDEVVSVSVNPTFFRPRPDYEHWTGHSLSFES